MQDLLHKDANSCSVVTANAFDGVLSTSDNTEQWINSQLFFYIY